MPNHVRNCLTVAGSMTHVEAFVRKAATETPQRPSAPHLNFHELVPLPAAYFTSDYTNVGYNLEVNTWGVKWGAYEVVPPLVAPEQAHYVFTTAWNCPDLFLRRVSALWEPLTFFLSFGGEGPTRGRRIYVGGDSQIIAVGSDGPDYPIYSDNFTDEEEEQHCEQYKAAQYFYTNSHLDWMQSV